MLENPGHELWSHVTGLLDSSQNVPASSMGFIRLAEVKGVIGDTIYLEVPNDLTRNMLEQRLREDINQAIREATASQSFPGINEEVLNFAVVVNTSLTQVYNPVISAVPETPEPSYPVADSTPTGSITRFNANWDTRLNEKYTFENFVMGSTNQFARAAAFAVSESPAKAYNPLFIYGNSGLGKTHLLHAIGHYALHLFPRFKVRYVSSEEFTNDFINAIQNNRSNQFLSEYRDIDILLIDDIQFLKGKDQTQEAFFHTFNALHDANKQVVITCDVPPKALEGFEDRMLSRFEWGLRVDIQAPELETRIAILRKKAELDKTNIGDDVLEYMASRIQSNVRELEGSLVRVSAYASLSRRPIDMTLAQTVLKDFSPAAEERVFAPVEIINTIASYYQISPDEIFGKSRTSGVVHARQIAMYLCREQTNLSLPKIGQLFGGRDHTTVMYACRKVTDLMRNQRAFYNEITELLTQLKNKAR